MVVMGLLLREALKVEGVVEVATCWLICGMME
jgi:hypothetical protein